ncbi:hypothetical protein CXB49_04755 [Chromobacterium sp. ATCC 53434]|uniref:hypothetical protein n=1 Tax=Chromobacterium TaxID=535 RepID=UPI000C7711EC|nr:hypothetical protein [Chromobacterium sp. ATCC 53434]AUH50177.1 hypothetical protein CXB49_04755 [Chromobacterium sp. ATCC 53434]
MSLGAVGSSLPVSYLPAASAGALPRTEPGGANAAGAARNGRDNGPGSGFGQEVVLALQQSGVNVIGAMTGAGSASGKAGDSDAGGIGAVGAPSAGGNVQQALHTFVHAVYQAVQSEGLSGGGTGNGQQGPAAGGYGDFQSNLQQLLQDVREGTQNNATSGLTAAFRSLQQALGGDTPTGASTQSSLHTFLQNLVTLQNGQQMNAGGVGSLVDTSA